jgi:membrane protease YdiL (CAAX protease family)
MSKSQIILLILIVIATAWAGQLVALHVAGGPEQLGNSLSFVWIMFTPALCSLVYLTMHREHWRYVQWRLGRISLLIAAPLFPALLGLVIIGIVAWIGWGDSAYFDFRKTGVVITDGPWLLGTGEQNWLVFFTNYAVTAVVYGAVSGLATVGEEFGWRGFLQPVLIEKLGITLGVFTLGLVWALWHLPIMLAGYNYPDHPVLGALLLFPALLVAASFMLAWITLRSGSFWPAVLVHGSINSVYQAVVGEKLTPNVSRLHIDLLEIIVFAVIALVFWAALTRNGRSVDDQVVSNGDSISRY